jgi:L-idonate 5-dehydrogenase
MARQIGADFVLDPTDEASVRQAMERAGDGFDVVFEAAGAEAALRQAFELARRGGTIVQIGVMSAPEVTLPANQVMINELTVIGSFRYADVFDEGVRLLAAGRVNLRPLIRRVFPLARINEAMALACARNDAVKVQLDFLQTI